MKIQRFIGGMLESNGYVIYQKDEMCIRDSGDTVRIFVDNVNTDRGEIDFLLADFSPYQGQD